MKMQNITPPQKNIIFLTLLVAFTAFSLLACANEYSFSDIAQDGQEHFVVYNVGKCNYSSVETPSDSTAYLHTQTPTLLAGPKCADSSGSNQSFKGWLVKGSTDDGLKQAGDKVGFVAGGSVSIVATAKWGN